MGIVVRAFMGRDLAIPEDRLYFPGEDLWVRDEGGGVHAVGLTEAGVLVTGGVRQVDLLVREGEAVEAGRTVCLALTAKVRYLASPLAGEVSFARPGPGINDDPYGTPLFRVRARNPDLSRLVDAAGYAAVLADSEGARNPGGAKGPGSSICKALYWGIRQQKLEGP